MATDLPQYLLGALGAIAVAARLLGAAGLPAWRSAAGRRAAVLSASVVSAALAYVARVPPVQAQLDALLQPDAAWLVADTLWLAAGFLGLLWIDPVMEPPPPDAPEWSLPRAVWRPRSFLIALIAVNLWGAAWQHPEAWSVLQAGLPAQTGLGLLPLAYVIYQCYLCALAIYFVHALWRLRAVTETRSEYLRTSTGLLAAVIYTASPALRATALFTQWRMPYDTAWSAVLPTVQSAQLASAALAVLVLLPPRVAGILFAPLHASERRQAARELERFHAWLAAGHPELARPAPHAPEGTHTPLVEIERAARYALAVAPAATRARLAELGEQRIYIAGRQTRRAEPAALLIAGALRSWPRDRMPAELPRFRFVGDDGARLVFWGWVASLVTAATL